MAKQSNTRVVTGLVRLSYFSLLRILLTVEMFRFLPLGVKMLFFTQFFLVENIDFMLLSN